ncbi:cytochrome oxidase small assembly protein [Aquabacterium sp. J223]|nr:cytochrome oxidase small assembly protein [Aquabacterium sp. J223]UUX95683.1 cytochrome oxidase small assembly protein [Aquabacterium sp. J223]
MPAAMTDRHDADQRRRNLRLGLILASVAVAFAAGFVVKIALLS